MAKRKYKLTWQKGTNGRPGRWKKIINGTPHYFDGGRGKTDQVAYKAAFKAYEKLKAEFSVTQNPHRTEYLSAIGEWEAVAVWSKENGEEEKLAIAEKKILALNKRLAKGSKCQPLRREDKFVTEPEWRVFEEDGRKVRMLDPNKYIEEDWSPSGSGFGFKLWRDRLDSVKRRAGITDEIECSVGVIMDKFVNSKTRTYRDGKLSASRLACLKASTALFTSFVGSTKDLAAVNGRTMTSFFEHLQVKVDDKSINPATGRDHASNTAQFLRWAWKQEHIDSLPRNLSDHGITVTAKEIEVFSISEIKKLLTAASPRMRLFILLALNAGMTQKDISDLHPKEVNWRRKTIKRKRSKTKKKKKTPTVTYTLWPETLRLLKEFKTNDKQRVLLNKFGLPLKDEDFVDGKHRKTDAVGREFRRLKLKCKIKGRSFICLKKTSRSLLEDNRDFHPIAELFVGRAPKTVSEKSYARPAENWLADATEWLRGKLKIAKAIKDADA